MTQTVFDQIMSIRDGGTINMLDVNGVQHIAYENEFFDLVIYIEDDKSRYFHFIMSGELPDGEENPAAPSSTVDNLSDNHMGEDCVDVTLSDAHKGDNGLYDVRTEDNSLSFGHNGVDEKENDAHTGEKGGDAL